jgi:protein O-mannosyl-transferase
MLKDFNRSAMALKKGIHWKNATSTNYKHYGISLFNLKRYKEAIPVFKKGLQKFPDDIEMASNLGNAYGAAANYREAGQTFEMIYNKDSSNVNALRLLIISYEQAGNREKVDQYRSFLK